MITIIHGEDVSTSRRYYQELKAKHKNLILFDGKSLTITSLVQNIKGSGLFSQANVIFIEDLLTKTKKATTDAKEILALISKNSKDSTFVLWESKEVSKRDLFLFKDAVIKSFKLPQNIFLFLDNLKPNNSNQLLNLFHKAINSGIKEEIILFMMQRQLRLLLSLCHPEASAEGSLEILRSAQNDTGTIDEVSRLATWQKSKIEKQARLFDVPTLKKMYKKLYEIEIGYKTGGLSLSLSQTIDFLLFEM